MVLITVFYPNLDKAPHVIGEKFTTSQQTKATLVNRTRTSQTVLPLSSGKELPFPMP